MTFPKHMLSFNSTLLRGEQALITLGPVQIGISHQLFVNVPLSHPLRIFVVFGWETSQVLRAERTHVQWRQFRATVKSKCKQNGETVGILQTCASNTVLFI